MNTTSLLLVLVAAASGTMAGMQQGRWLLKSHQFRLGEVRDHPEDYPDMGQFFIDTFDSDQRARRRWAWPTLVVALACLALVVYLLIAGARDPMELVLLAGVSLLTPWLGITGSRCLLWTGDGPHALTGLDTAHRAS